MFEKFMSPYLSEGFKGDEFQINSIDISDNNKNAIAYVDLVTHAASLDGVFHLSSLTNSRIVQQMGVIFSFHILQKEKDREIFYLSDSWKYKRPIEKLKNIKYQYENITLRRCKEQTIGRCQISVEEGSFVGNLVWLIPNKVYEIFNK